MPRTQLDEIEERAEHLRTLEKQVDRALRAEGKQKKAARRAGGGLSAGRITLYTFGAIVAVALVTKFIVPILLVVGLAAGVWWLVTKLSKRR